MKKRFLAGFLAICFLCGSLNNQVLAEETSTLTEKQMNSISMLNYLTVLTEEIHGSDKSRLYLENIYSNIVNNTNPNAIDIQTQRYLGDIRDMVQKYRASKIKREHLEYIYENNQAQAIKAAIPNPMGLLSTIIAGKKESAAAESGSDEMDLSLLAFAVAYMAIDSALSYISAKSDIELDYLKSGWELDEQEDELLYESRSAAFDYMVNIVRENNLEGNKALSQEAVKDYVTWKQQPNLAQRIQFFESNKETYQFYGGYWLTLASAYYENNNYKKCIDAVRSYEDRKINIFRYDYDYAKILTLAIAAASKVQKEKEYISNTKIWLKKLLKNTQEKNWALRYFAAITYLDLFVKTDDATYLQEAFEIEVNNVNHLASIQKQKNKKYLSDFAGEIIPAGIPKDERKELEKYNKTLKEARKTELPPVYEPFIINCDLLFSILKNDELNIPLERRRSINQMLHEDGDMIFLNDILDSEYWINVADNGYTFGSELAHQSFDVDFDGSKLTIPAFLVTEDAEIVAHVNGNEIMFSDWEIQEVKRNDKVDFGTYVATFYSKKADKYAYGSTDKVRVEIIPKKDMSYKKYQLRFEVIDSFKSIIPIPPFSLLDSVTFQVVQ